MLFTQTPSAYSAPGTPPANRTSFVGVTPRDPGGLYQAQVSRFIWHCQAKFRGDSKQTRLLEYNEPLASVKKTNQSPLTHGDMILYGKVSIDLSLGLK